jgi:hypothetical protein
MEPKDVVVKTVVRFNILHTEQINIGPKFIEVVTVYKHDLDLEELNDFKSEVMLARYYLSIEEYEGLASMSDVAGLTYGDLLNLKDLMYVWAFPTIKEDDETPII